eukprot:s1366_g26.t1
MTLLEPPGGSWPTLPPQLFKQLDQAYAQMLRKVLRLGEAAVSWSHAKIFAEANTSDMRVLMAVERLTLAQRLFAKSPCFLQHLLQCEYQQCQHSWLEGLRHDLHWLAALMPDALPANWSHDMTDLFEMWQNHQVPWKRWVKRAFGRHCQQEGMMVHVHALHHTVFQTLRQAGATFTSADTVDDLAQDYRCFCHAAFASKRGLLAHQRKAHALFSPERPFLQGATCLHCGIHFWTTQRLQQHLAYIPKKLGYNPCYWALKSQDLQVDYENVTFPAFIRGLARKESVATAGPRNLVPSALDQQRARWTAKLSDCRAQLVFPWQPEDPLQWGARVGDALTDATLAWFRAHYPQGPSLEDIQDLGNRWLDILSSVPPDVESDQWCAFVFMTWGEQWLPDLIAGLLDGQAEQDIEDCYAEIVGLFPRFQILGRITQLEACLRQAHDDPLPYAHRPSLPLGARPRHPKRTSGPIQPISTLFGDQFSWQQVLRQGRFDILPTTLACPLYRSPPEPPVFLLVHLFSGRRRWGDFHDHVQKLAAALPFTVIVLSMDTAISAEYGDLSMQSPNWQQLIKCYTAGRVAGTLCGPPCETFSEARFTPAPDSECRWPRPLRSWERLFGLAGLTNRELRQVSVGSLFFLQCIYVLALHMQFGGVFIAEHPAPPQDATRPSIWTSAIVEQLLQHPDLTLHRIAQYLWGASAIKPTGLLAWQLPFFQRDLYRFADFSLPRPQQVAIGKNADGTFRTSQHKEYPSGLCEALAAVIVQQLRRVFSSHSVRSSVPASDVDQWVAHADAVGNHIDPARGWLPDFQG